MKPLVSVVIPVYNHASALKKSLFSLHEQIYRPLEIILVDDGSTDNLAEVLSKMEDEKWYQDLSVKFFHFENRGAPAARNSGLKASSGEYVIFWDADTLAKSDMILKMVKTLNENPDVSFVYSRFRFGWKIIKSRDFDVDELKKNNYIDTTSLVRRRDVVPFDESLRRFQDWDLWLTLSERGFKGKFIPEVLFKKEVSGRLGISKWLPSFIYKLPWQSLEVKKYKKAKEIIIEKHRLVGNTK